MWLAVFGLFVFLGLILSGVVSKRKQVQEVSKGSEARYRGLFNNMSSGVAVYEAVDNGRDFVFVDINRAVEQIDKVKKENLIGKSVLDVFPGIIGFGLFDVLQRVWETGEAEYHPVSQYKDERIIGWRENYVYKLPSGEVVAVYDDVTERKQAEAQIQRQMERLSALHEIDRAVTTIVDIRHTLNVIIQKVISLLEVDAAGVLLFNPDTRLLEYGMISGLQFVSISLPGFQLEDGFAGQAVRDRKMVVIQDLSACEDAQKKLRFSSGEAVVGYYAVPLIAKREVKGVLEIYHRKRLHPNAEWLDFLKTLAEQAAIAIDNITLFSDLQSSKLELELAYDNTLQGWAHALELRDYETKGHSMRVTEMTVHLAKMMGINSEEEIVHIRRGAILHDIGKMGIPDSILLKPGPLTTKEWKIIHKHPTYGYEMLLPTEFLKPALDVVLYHHEKWDGTGYQSGLKGEEIPLSARLFAIVDVWDSLIHDRPYKKAWSKEKAREYIMEQSGIHFDPKITDVFVNILDHNL